VRRKQKVVEKDVITEKVPRLAVPVRKQAKVKEADTFDVPMSMKSALKTAKSDLTEVSGKKISFLIT
jgi:hypothetical protein